MHSSTFAMLHEWMEKERPREGFSGRSFWLQTSMFRERGFFYRFALRNAPSPRSPFYRQTIELEGTDLDEVILRALEIAANEEESDEMMKGQ